MKWEYLRNIRKYAEINDVFEVLGEPKFKLFPKSIYYLGKGFSLGFHKTFGDASEYAFSLYYFRNRFELEKNFLIHDPNYEFEGEVLGEEFEIVEGVRLGNTFEEVAKALQTSKLKRFYKEAEVGKADSEGELEFCHQKIIWNDYEFLFFGKTKETPLSAFKYMLRN